MRVDPTIHAKRGRSSAAERAGLPRITVANAVDYPPPSLDSFRTPSSRAAADAAPVLWYWQMTGELWDRESRSYQLVRKKHWRMVPANQLKEKQRLGGRVPLDSNRPLNNELFERCPELGVDRFFRTRDELGVDRKNEPAKRRRLEAARTIPQQLEQGTYRCPRCQSNSVGLMDRPHVRLHILSAALCREDGPKVAGPTLSCLQVVSAMGPASDPRANCRCKACGAHRISSNHMDTLYHDDGTLRGQHQWSTYTPGSCTCFGHSNAHNSDCSYGCLYRRKVEL